MRDWKRAKAGHRGADLHDREQMVTAWCGHSAPIELDQDNNPQAPARCPSCVGRLMANIIHGVNNSEGMPTKARKVIDMNNHVIILSGVSGSGKSTYARTRLGGADVVSADSYFVQRDGVYAFDATKLSLAHGACFRRFLGLLEHTDENTIVVDNTNITSEEIAPYVLGAQAFGATVEICTLMGCYVNVHGVPEMTIAAQRKRIGARRLPPWWKHSYVDVVSQ